MRHTLDRRGFLALAAGSGTLGLAGMLGSCSMPQGPSSAPPTPPLRTLRAGAFRQPLLGPGEAETPVWGYEGSVPGPVLRYRQGERLVVEVENALEVDTTVHFHGIRLPNAMDGVPHLTQAPIALNGGRFVYDFTLPDAGTYWYHPHLASSGQVGRGLYGALIVEEARPPEVDRDIVCVLSDWRLDREGRIVGNFANAHDATHAGRIGNTITVNGHVRAALEVRAGERIRLRLVNAANARIFNLAFEGHAPVVIALDGHPVAPHAPADGHVLLGPAQRADLILDCAGTPGNVYRVIDASPHGRPHRVLDLAYATTPALGVQRGPVTALEPNPVAHPDLANATTHRIVFAGGMMGKLPDQKAHPGMFWTVNGTPYPADTHDHAPMLKLAVGRSYRMELVNDTAWPHPIHLHGHAFRILSRDGKPLPRETWSDTVLLDADEGAEIAFVADNPGKWMFHCHILEHQASGMMAVIEVA